jgi:phage tail sheath protein FI
MPEYLSPGVYVQEVDSGTRPIEGVGTACAAFSGMAPEGPANMPVLVTNWTQYVEAFGSRDEKNGKRDPHMAGSYLSHSVYGYFLNGGGRCYVTRVVPMANGKGSKDGQSELPQLQLPSRAASKAPALTVKAKSAPTSDIEIEILPPTGEGPPEGTFTLRSRMSGAEDELYENVGMGRRAAKNVAETVNTASKLVTVLEEQGTGSLAERAPDLGTQTLHAPKQTQIQSTVKVDDFAGDPSQRSGMEGLQIAEDVTMVACPDLMAAYEAGILTRDQVKAVQLKMIAHCELMGDRLAILDPLPGLTPQEVKAWREVEAGYDSKYAVMYYPWIKVAGPGGVTMAMPPSGHMAGIWARSDNERGVHKAPANEVVRGVLAPATPVTKG